MKPRRSGRRPHLLLVVENVAIARDHRLRKQAETLVAAGYDVSVICRRDPDNRRCNDIRVYDYRAPVDAANAVGFAREYAYSWTMAAWLTARVFLTRPFDAIQVSGTPDIYFAMALPYRLLRRPLVLDQRDLSPELFEVRYGRRGPVYRILRWLEWASYRKADHVITVNGSLEQIVRDRGARTAISVVGNGPRLGRIRALPTNPGLRQGRRHLCLWLGFMGPQDRVDLALHAVAHLVHRIGRVDCHFAFVGDGETRTMSQALAAELGITDWVSFPGWADESEAASYLSSAHLGLEPNLEEIVSPVKAMEYMAFGLPFVAFDLKETRTLAHGAAAYATRGRTDELAELIDGLLDQPARRHEMGLLGRALVEDHVAWEHQEAVYVDIYRRLLTPTRRRAGRRRKGV